MARERYQIHIDDHTYSLEAEGNEVYEDGVSVPISVESLGGGRYSVLLDGRSITLTVEGRQANTLSVRSTQGLRELRWLDNRGLMLSALGLTNGQDDTHRDVLAPMPGLVRRVMVSAGQVVESGESLLILEAMKMENELKAPAAGTVKQVHAAAGDSVVKSQLLIEIES